MYCIRIIATFVKYIRIIIAQGKRNIKCRMSFQKIYCQTVFIICHAASPFEHNRLVHNNNKNVDYIINTSIINNINSEFLCVQYRHSFAHLSIKRNT